ncbi:MAG: ABC transporter ATP-binding protein [Clostridiales bacterium]|nr:ABC transporter ATP-binding protein [Clostridiales bacterium]
MEKNHQSSTFLSVRDLVVQYTSDGKIVQAVNGVSLTLEKGKTLGLVGETGAGKTTTAKSIMRILQEPPAKIVSGEVLLEGKNLLTLPQKEMRKYRGTKISMIFQDPMTALNPVKRVKNQIAEVIGLHDKCGRKEAGERAIAMLEKVGIAADRAREYPHQFSGGMQQRVVIAMALACNPDLLLADEPTTALDVTIQAQVLEMIRKLQKDSNTAMVLITHDLGVVAENCDHVAVMYAGQIVEYGSLIDVFDHPLHPYTRGLFASLPKMTDDAARLSPILGMPPDPTNLPVGCKFNPRCPHATDQCRETEIAIEEITPGHLCRCCCLEKQEVQDGIIY